VEVHSVYNIRERRKSLPDLISESEYYK
jgi:hypothetical protein